MIKLNLGAGNDKKEDYLNIDNSPLVSPDILCDLEEAKLPFEDSSVDEIIAYHVLEHITNFIPLVYELHRVCKSGAKIYVRCPFYSGWGQYNDPTHVRFFSLYTFNYFRKNNYSHECGVDKDMFEYKVSLNYGIGKMKFMNWLMNPLINLWKDFYCRFLAFIIPATEIRYELTVLK